MNATNFRWIALGHIFLVYVVFGLILFSFVYAGMGVLKFKSKARKIALWATGVNVLSFVSTNYGWRANITRILLISASIIIYYFLFKKPIKEQFNNNT